MNCEISDVQARYRKSRGNRDQINNIPGSAKMQDSSRKKKIYFCFIEYSKDFVCVDPNKLSEIIQVMRIPDHLTCLLRNLYPDFYIKKQQLELDMEQQTCSKPGKEYVKAVYCHPAYLTYMQSASHKMPGWMKHKLE